MRALLPAALFLAACTEELGEEALRPSLTMFRTGEAVPEEWDEPVVVPEDRYLPGIVEGPQDFEYDGVAERSTARMRDDAFMDLEPMIDLDDPAMLEKHAPTYAYSRKVGGLTRGDDDIDWQDVQQGAIGDCYYAAAFSAVLYADVERFARDGLIRPITDGQGRPTHFAVRFYDAWGKPQDVTVDVDIVRRNDKPLYIRSGDSNADGEEWAISLVEKAYAQWHGGYEKIGNGGWAGDVMQAISGSKATYRSLAQLSDQSLVSGITSAVAENRPVVAGTFGEDDGVDYTGSGVYAWHAYSVHGAKQIEGEWYVELRNPWGVDEPSPDHIDGKNDGRFYMKLTDFRRWYQGITYGGGFRDDVTAPSAPNDLALSEHLGDKAVLKFTATGDDGTRGLAARYDVRVSNAAITTSNFYSATQVQVASPQVPGTLETFQVEVGSEPVFVALRVEDESGNISSLSGVVEIRPEDAPPPPTLDFEFEDGAPGWEATGLWHLSDLDATSGTHAYWFGDPDTVSYDVGSRPQGALTSPILDLVGTTTPTLYWEHILDVEAGDARDVAVVEVATSAGGYANWATVWTKAAPNAAWQITEADLTDYAGQKIRARWRFDAVDATDNAGIGWLVDDVEVLD